MKDSRHSTGSCRNTRTPAAPRVSGAQQVGAAITPWGCPTWEGSGCLAEEGVGRPPGAVQGRQPHIQLEVIPQDPVSFGARRLLAIHRVPQAVPLLAQRPHAVTQHSCPCTRAALLPPARHQASGYSEWPHTAPPSDRKALLSHRKACPDASTRSRRSSAEGQRSHRHRAGQAEGASRSAMGLRPRRGNRLRLHSHTMTPTCTHGTLSSGEDSCRCPLVSQCSAAPCSAPPAPSIPAPIAHPTYPPISSPLSHPHAAPKPAPRPVQYPQPPPPP